VTFIVLIGHKTNWMMLLISAWHRPWAPHCGVTDGQTDYIMMPIADHAVMLCIYRRRLNREWV